MAQIVDAKAEKVKSEYYKQNRNAFTQYVVIDKLSRRPT